jgi:hypothetical protein
MGSTDGSSSVIEEAVDYQGTEKIESIRIYYPGD